MAPTTFNSSNGRSTASEREREGDGEVGGKGERGKEREECPCPGSQRILVEKSLEGASARVSWTEL